MRALILVAHVDGEHCAVGVLVLQDVSALCCNERRERLKKTRNEITHLRVVSGWVVLYTMKTRHKRLPHSFNIMKAHRGVADLVPLCSSNSAIGV
jgi:hypothetical protein